MIAIRVDPLALQRAKEKIVTRVNTRYRAQVYKIFEDLLLVSAQYSGDYTSNWRITTDPTNMGYEMWPGKLEMRNAKHPMPHRAGDFEAAVHARTRAERVPFNWEQKVYFVNATPLEFTGTTVTGPDGTTRKLRPENIIAGGVQIASYLYAHHQGGF